MGLTETIGVLVVERKPLVRAGLVSLMTRTDGLRVAGVCESPDEALAIVESAAPDVVVLSNSAEGVDYPLACRDILRRRPAASVMVLAATYDDPFLHACLVAGARGFLLKDSTEADLVHGVRALAAGDSVLAPEVLGRVIDWARQSRAFHGGPDELSAAELLALSLLAHGHTSREIARRLKVSESAAKTRIRSAQRKLGAHDRSQAVATGIRMGLI
jgi:DNA-binding NarL/FixJ family response regulator